MKIFQKKYFLLLLVMTIFSSTTLFSQSLRQGDPSRSVEVMASESVEMWSEELGLTNKQELLMEKKIIEFAMKREELLQSKMREDAKKAAIMALQTEENQDMSDILTQPQYEKYLVLQQQRIGEQKKIDDK